MNPKSLKGIPLAPKGNPKSLKGLMSEKGKIIYKYNISRHVPLPLEGVRGRLFLTS